MRKAVIALLAVVALGVVGYVVWVNMNDPDYNQTSSDDVNTNSAADDESTNTDSEEATATNEVSYTDSGFSPSTITVTPGTKVTWTNDSGSSMWVASDPHPVHTDFSAFDQKSAGDAYSFTFDEAGTYEYHNHQNSGDTGTVIVEE